MKQFIIISLSLLALAFGASAQKNLYLVDTDGNLSALKISSVDSLKFNGRSALSITTKVSVDDVTETSYKATTTVALGNGVKSLTGASQAEVGVCYSSTTLIPTIDDECKTLGTGLADYTISFDGLTTGAVFYYRTYVKLLNDVFYGDVMRGCTLIVINGHKFYDLGLPSGTLWAACNLEAEDNLPSGGGDYYAWGETSSKSKGYNWSTYKWGTSSDALTKYTATDGLTTLEASDDTATAAWGEGCRMPTKAECQELLEQCTWEWQDDYDDSQGYKVTGPDGLYIFLPSNGYRSSGGSVYNSESGFYWSSSLGSESSDTAFILNFSSESQQTTAKSRMFGYSIRPVAAK